MVLVRETVMTDWQALRDIRLLALRDAPDAFGSTYAEQVRFGEADWRQRIARGGTFLAYIPEVDASEPAGMIGGYQRRQAWSSSFPCSSGRGLAAAASARR